MSVNTVKYWYGIKLHLVNYLLLPFAWLYGAITALRRYCYARGIFKSYRFPVPVIVVGNLTIGGTGKTPFVIWLATFLRSEGYRPGIVSRGYSGERHQKPHRVSVNDLPAKVGDEAILLAQRTDCPVVVSVDRPAAVAKLLQETACNIVICDDGLQHYRLARNLEIVLVDGMRRFGNHQLLPAGPLREPLHRLHSVDFTVITNGHASRECNMLLEPDEIIQLQTQEKLSVETFLSQHPCIHAVAGIGNPQRFFNMLEEAGFTVIPHVFPDHHAYSVRDLQFTEKHPIVMTEKDAVKCVAFADPSYWCVTITANLNTAFEERLLQRIKFTEMNHA